MKKLELVTKNYRSNLSFTLFQNYSDYNEVRASGSFCADEFDKKSDMPTIKELKNKYPELTWKLASKLKYEIKLWMSGVNKYNW